MFARLARWICRRPWYAIAAWVVVVALGVGLGTRVFDNIDPLQLGEPDQESTIAAERIERLSDGGPQILALATGVPVDDAELTASLAETAAKVRAVDGVRQVADITSLPPDSPAAQALVAGDGRATLVRVTLQEDLGEARQERVTDEVTEQLRGIQAPEVLVGGEHLLMEEFVHQSEEDLVRGELIAFPVMLILLVVLFAGLLPAALPLVVAGVGIAGGLLLLYVVSLATSINSYAVNVVTMLGLGLAVDYSLLMVSRFREERASGWDVHAAVTRTMTAAGRTVLFSGLTIAACLAGLLAVNEGWLRAFAWGGVGVVMVAMLAAVTLIPALLVLVGHRLKLHRTDQAGEGGFFYRLSRLVQRGAVGIVVLVAAGLLLVAYPFTHAELQNSGWDTLPRSSENRQLFQQLTDRFPAVGTDPVQVVAEVPADDPRVAAYVERVGALPDVRGSGVHPLGEATTLVELVPAGSAEGPEARALVGELRELDTSFTTLVGGRAASLVDYRDSLAERLPWVLGLMGLATVILLFLMTGSLVIPVKAILMAALSLGASFGALVWGFQDGHLADLLGFDPVGYVDVTIPVLMFVFAFGLSMDYEVFLLSRIKESYDESGDNDLAVAVGLQRTGRIVTAAAALITVVFLGLVSSELLVLKQIGLGLALAVVLDATVVRALLVPATMKLLGRWNWWAPGPLRRLHERFGLHEVPATPAEQSPDRTPV